MKRTVFIFACVGVCLLAGEASAAFKFKRNFLNNEVLQILEDLVQGKKLLPGR